MFTLNDDLSIYATRGDIVFFSVSMEEDGAARFFQPGDVVRIKVYGKKDAEAVVLQKDFPVTDLTQNVQIFLTKEDTEIGEVISKHKDYWYEVVLNDDTNPQTIIGYDEDGAKIFRLFPEGDDIPPYVPDIKPEDIPVVDEELDIMSPRPIQNQAVAKAVAKLGAEFKEQTGELIANIHNSDGFIQKIVDVCKTYTDNFDKLVYGNAYTAYDANTQQVDGKWQLDCSSFQNLLIRGVTFENSRYAGNEDNKEDPLFFNKFDPYEFRLANKMAQWLYNNGYTFAPKADYSNIEPGDLVFYSWPFITGEFHDNAFMNIDHVAMFLQKKNDAIYQTIQYEKYTPNFFHDVSEDYMSGAVLVARLPFPMVENPGENIIVDFDKTAALVDSSDFIVGEYNLAKPMIPGKMYTCCFKGKIETEDSYFLLRGYQSANLFTNYGEVWDGKEKEYKFSFICPEMGDYTKLYLSCSAGNGTTRTASAKNFCMYEGYKRAYNDSAVSSPYPIYRDFVFADDIISDMNGAMAPGGYVLEFRDYYILSLNVPLKTLRTGNVHIGSLGKQVSETRRIPANLVGADGTTNHYNGFLQISSGSTIGDVYVNTWNSSQKYQYIMANGVIAK